MKWEFNNFNNVFILHWVTSVHLNVIYLLPLSPDRSDPPSSVPFVSQLTHTSLVLSWSGPCYDGGSAITGYVVELQRLDGSEPEDWSELVNQCQNTSYRVCSGLDSQGEYRFRVRACNAAGVSEPSKESDCIKMDTAGTTISHNAVKKRNTLVYYLNSTVNVTAEPQEEVTSYVDVVIDTTHKARDYYHVHEKLGVWVSASSFESVLMLVSLNTSVFDMSAGGSLGRCTGWPTSRWVECVPVNSTGPAATERKQRPVKKSSWWMNCTIPSWFSVSRHSTRPLNLSWFSSSGLKITLQTH